MTAVPRISIGAPGLYRDVPAARPPMAGERMDVCAFVGVAPRGPARVPREPEAFAHDRALVGAGIARRRSVAVPVESWEEYRRLFGGFEGPGRLAYAVSLFFEQGGRKAYIVRIVHQYLGAEVDKNHEGAAQGVLGNAVPSAGALTLEARDEGSWGNALRAALGYSVTPIELLADSTATELVVSIDENVVPGTAFRLGVEVGGVMEQEVRFAERVRRRGLDTGGGERAGRHPEHGGRRRARARGDPGRGLADRGRRRSHGTFSGPGTVFDPSEVGGDGPIQPVEARLPAC